MTSLERATEVAEAIARGNFSLDYVATSSEDTRLATAMNQMTSRLKAVVQQMNIIAQGRYDLDFVPIDDGDEMGIAVRDMTEMLREMSIENKKLAWIKSGQAELSVITRGDRETGDLGKNIISFLARYINALVGNIYQVDMNKGDSLQLIGSFALPRANNDRTCVEFGEGLVGQCALEKELIIFNDVPEGYLTIQSSLGETAPRHIVVVPFLIEKEVKGVLELGSLDAFDETKIELLRQVSEHIAIALKSAQNSHKMKYLLAESKQQSEELQVQQEELRRSNEELELQTKRTQSKSGLC